MSRTADGALSGAADKVQIGAFISTKEEPGAKIPIAGRTKSGSIIEFN